MYDAHAGEEHLCHDFCGKSSRDLVLCHQLVQSITQRVAHCGLSVELQGCHGYQVTLFVFQTM